MCACVTDAGIGTRLLAGCTTGAMAVAFAQPTDVVKVRFQAQVRLPESGSVKRYSSTIDAYKTIARDEGVKGLWKGKLHWWDENICEYNVVGTSVCLDLFFLMDKLHLIKGYTPNRNCC